MPIIVKHTVLQRCTITAEYYCTFLQDNLQAALKRKRRHFLNNPPIILYDNARAHAGGAVTDLLNHWGWEVLYHLPYSPDYNLIPKMEEPLHGTRFCTVHDVFQTSNRSLCNIQILDSANGIQHLPHHWE